MEHLNTHQEREFIEEWLRQLCLKGITSMNLGHDPGLRGLMAVTRYLEEKVGGLPMSDGLWQIYREFFQPSPIEGSYGKLWSFLANSRMVISRFEMGSGDTFNFAAYEHRNISPSILPVYELAAELAEVFAQAYHGSSAGK